MKNREKNDQKESQENSDLSDLNVEGEALYVTISDPKNVNVIGTSCFNLLEVESYSTPKILGNDSVLIQDSREEMEFLPELRIATTGCRDSNEFAFPGINFSANKAYDGFWLNLEPLESGEGSNDPAHHYGPLSSQSFLLSNNQVCRTNPICFDQSSSVLTKADGIIGDVNFALGDNPSQIFESPYETEFIEKDFGDLQVTVHSNNANHLTLAEGLYEDLEYGSIIPTALSITGERGVENLALAHLNQDGLLDQEDVINIGTGSAFNHQSNLFGDGVRIAGEMDWKLVTDGCLDNVGQAYGLMEYESEMFPNRNSNVIDDDLITQTVNEALDHFGKSLTFDRSKISIESFARTYQLSRSDTFGNVTNNIVMVNIINIEGDVSHNDIYLSCQSTN